MPPPADVNIDDYGCGTQLSVWCARCGKKTATVRFLLRAWRILQDFAGICRASLRSKLAPLRSVQFVSSNCSVGFPCGILVAT
jgi:hypothetical protein